MSCKEWFNNIEKNPFTHRPILPFRQTFTSLENGCYPLVSGKTLYGLNNRGSSCYADSILVSLFAKPNEIINRYILQQKIKPRSESKRYYHICSRNNNKDVKKRKRVQNTLREIVLSMRYKRNIKYCYNLREALAKCKPPQNFHLSGEQDAKEYLQYIFDLFGMNVARSISTTYLTNDLETVTKSLKTRTTIDRFSSFVWDIDHETLTNIKGNTSLQNLLTITFDSVLEPGSEYRRKFGKNTVLYQRVISVKKMIDTPYLVFHIIRLDPVTGIYNSKKVVPPQTITVHPKRILTLSAIILYQNHHYMCNFLDGLGDWYHYDDLEPQPQYLGTYERMMEKEDPRSRGILFFYT